MSIARPIQAMRPANVFRSSTSGCTTRPTIVPLGIDARIRCNIPRIWLPPAIPRHNRMRGSMRAPRTSMTRLITMMIVA